MSLVRVHNFSVSLDGFGAGEGQQLHAPFGHAGSRLVEWAFATRTFREMGIVHRKLEGSGSCVARVCGRVYGPPDRSSNTWSGPVSGRRGTARTAIGRSFRCSPASPADPG